MDHRATTSLIAVSAAALLLAVRSNPPVVYTRVGGPLVGPDGGAPAGWNRPEQRGWVSKDGDRLRFEDERGHSEVFERAPAEHVPGSCPGELHG
ncbi:hypothetical protein SAMN06264364_13612 [Quadrisphaera granulorum]|uniref:Uncharacterized protein n=1 Tax=Quadrisphaera granulorum TaxID=317664 RepID=A0A315ZPT6_9ACTN|nr:hypothetical protein [Quadrisphaera granulorum]PWJ47581.1 hypothetical protein BXY45_13612 [Quadrisphaera granulorum]SZE98711.1 hypothetical protein SAMN06264364_13612 [Quadrisphaera granulorum]